MDNSLEAKIARMALTITTLKNKISTEKDSIRKMELNASLKRTIENFENTFLENRLQKLKSKKGGRKTNTRKNKTRKNKTRKHKTRKHKTRKHKTQKKKY